MPAIARPVFKPDISFKVEALEERATIVHCSMTEFSAARIWPSTYLVQEDGTRKALLQAFGIAPYPNWKWLLPGETFTLVFEGLDRNCLLFDLLEDIPEPGGFHIANIERNKSDVYRVFIDDEC
ncbi:MAG: hypothetical protein EOO11_17005 [Chitinophagaceae bacterium]|nr:MAG: hypothetical protein EOO11_17005 [Chitinophagaceae bacterium]